MKTLIAVLILSFSVLSQAQIYKCVDAAGKTVFSDQACAKDSAKAKVVDPKPGNVMTFKDVVVTSDNTRKALYKGSRVGRKSRFLSVSIHEETDTYMIFKVEVYYAGPSHGKGEYRVMPNIHWLARSFSTSDIGVSSGYARVELGSKAKDGDKSDVITLQLWQYTPGKSPRVLETRVVPYKKTWRLKD